MRNSITVSISHVSGYHADFPRDKDTWWKYQQEKKRCKLLPIQRWFTQSMLERQYFQYTMILQKEEMQWNVCMASHKTQENRSMEWSRRESKNFMM